MKTYPAVKVLLVLPSYAFMYNGTLVKIGAIYVPNLSLSTIAGALVKEGVDVHILDLNRKTEKDFIILLNKFNPDFVGFTFTTPLAEETLRLAKIAKKIKPEAVIICGGPHPSVMPLQVLSSGAIDVVCIGESDYTVLDIVRGKPYEDIKGIAFVRRDDKSYCETGPGGAITELDGLTFPAWNLFNISEYRTTRLFSRRDPVGFIETSRGCPYGCIYCNKKIFGKSFRAKSIKRVVDEMEYMLTCGFREIHLADDCFSFDIERAKGICEEIMKRGLKFSWATTNGIRVDRIDDELMRLMKRAGCYCVSFGIESGDDAILALAHKGQTCSQARNAITHAKSAGLEVIGFFMFALPGETEVTMQKTINFAKELDLDMAKVSIAIPFPGTQYFEELKKHGSIKETDWSKYNCYFPAREIYQHPSVSWDTVDIYFKRFYREFYLRPKFISKRFIKGFLNGGFISDINDFLRTKW